MSFRIKIIILAGLVIGGLLVNYEKNDEAFLFFPAAKNPQLGFIPLEKTPESSLFNQQKSWGWPFAYWEQGQFNFKTLIFDLIFYGAIWLLILFIIWFVGGIRRMQKRRLKPPKFDFKE